MKIERISVPTPFYVGPVNVYVIQEDPLTIIDVGPYTDEAREALKSGLSRLGHRLKDIKRIIISHAHSDHFGLARMVWEESGAEVLIHPWDASAVAGAPNHEPQRALLQKAGVPAEGLNRLKDGYERYSRFEQRLDSVKPLEDGSQVLFERESLRVVHTPGHTPGSICLLREGSRMMFSADTILKNITPNPVLNPDPLNPKRRFQSLGEYLGSLARVKALGPTLLKGGHGDDLDNYDEYFNRLHQFTRSRQNKLIGLLSRQGETAWDASLKLFPKAKGEHRFLALSETVAHLDYAVSENKISLDPSGATDQYRSL